MAYALVGSLGTVANGTTTVTPSFAQATTSGHLLVAWVYSGGISPVVSTSASGWAVGIAATNSGLGIFYKPNSSTGETAPTFSGPSGLAISAVLAEFSGGDTTAPIDQTGVINSAGTTSPAVCACAAADAASGELFLSCTRWSSSKAETVTSSDTYNNGATPTGNFNIDATSQSLHYRFAYGITTSNAAADQNSAANTSMNLNASTTECVASFKLAAAAAAVIPDVGVPLMVT